MKRIILSLMIGVLLAAHVPVTLVTAGDNNLLTNGSLEEQTNNAPTAWTTNKYGTNTASFVYGTPGQDGTKNATVNMTTYTSGDAKWIPTSVNVTPNTTYTFSDWYKGTAKSSLDAVYTTTTGKTTYKWLGDFAASADWKQTKHTFKTPANASKVTFYHSILAKGSLTTDSYVLVAGNGTTTPTPPVPTAPTVAMTAPTANSTLSGTQTISANASDAVGITSVQFQLDGVNLGTADTTAPYSLSWNTTTVTDGVHKLRAIATNTTSMQTTSSEVSVTVKNTVPPTAPTVTLTGPTANSTISGAQTITANATDAVSVTSVQFQLDGTDLGAADTTAPYSMNWDTTTVADGVHKLRAIATNNSSLKTTSAEISVTVKNVVTPPTPPTPTPTNLVPNQSVESALNNIPSNWHSNSWGVNTHQLTYESNGQDGTKSVKAAITAYTSGDAKWYFDDVAVTPGQVYAYSNWYKSNVDTELDAMVTMADGSVQYYYLTTASASPSAWQKVSTQFTAPAGAVKVSIFQVIAKVGYVQSDNFSFAAYQPATFNRGLVSITFDDGWRSIHTNGLPLLQKYNLPSTQYLLSSTTDYPDYMTLAMMKAFQDQGSEIAAHTVSHAHLTTLTAAQLTAELVNNQTFLRNNFGAQTAKNFATPYGEYNASVVTEIQKYYRSHRSTDVGFNSKDDFNIYNIKVQNITDTTTPAQVQAWVNTAITTKTWLVLVYHEVGETFEDPTYAVTTANLDAELNIVKQSGVTVKTVDQALDEIAPQL